MENMVVVILLLLVVVIGVIVAVIVVSSSSSTQKDGASLCPSNKPPLTTPQDVGKFCIAFIDAVLRYLKKSDQERKTVRDTLLSKLSGKFTISYPSGIRVYFDNECRVLEIPRLDDWTSDAIYAIILTEMDRRGKNVYGDDIIGGDYPIYITSAATKHQILGVRKNNIPSPSNKSPREIAEFLEKIEFIVENVQTKERKMISSVKFHHEDIQDVMALEESYEKNEAFFNSLIQIIFAELEKLKLI